MTTSRVAVLGVWHQGAVGAACLADWGYEVVGADVDAPTVERLQSGRAPLFEPGLDELVRRGLDAGRLKFTTELEAAARGARFLLVMFDTPVDENDESDLSGLFSAITRVIDSLEEGVILHVTAQVPVGTCDEIRRIIAERRPELAFAVAYSPENLRLGQAIERYRSPQLPVIGSDDAAALDALEQLYAPCNVQWQRVNLRTAEMSKHALNAFLAVSVCFANEIGNLCDEVGADGHRLAEVLRLEPRIGKKAMLMPGLGFSGGTLARDMRTMRNIGDRVGVDTPLLDGAWSSNQQQNKSVVRRLKGILGGLSGRRVAVLGLTYKAGTSTLRRSASLELVNDLGAAGAVVSGTDPKAERTELAAVPNLHVFDDPISAVAGVDAVVLMTPWPEYRALDFSRVRDAMRGNVVFDTANLWAADAVQSCGLQYLDIGRGRAPRS